MSILNFVFTFLFKECFFFNFTEWTDFIAGRTFGRLSWPTKGIDEMLIRDILCYNGFLYHVLTMVKDKDLTGVKYAVYISDGYGPMHLKVIIGREDIKNVLGWNDFQFDKMVTYYNETRSLWAEIAHYAYHIYFLQLQVPRLTSYYTLNENFMHFYRKK